MSSEILVSAEQLDDLIAAGSTVVVDCRFDLADPASGRSDWLAGHIPGASYAHLDDDLAAPVTPTTGRHPLPETEKFADFLASIGWSSNKNLVAYDDGSNAIAARLWWQMRYFGKRAALLDGGLGAWLDAGLPLEQGLPRASRATPETLMARAGLTVSAHQISANLDSDDLVIVDARTPERFSGEVEPLDARAGHIPGALNRPFSENLDDSGRFRSPGELRSAFETLLGGVDAGRVAHSCGSGVTACHNLFAMELAGLGGSFLYPGSWSHWITDSSRPIATG